MRASPLLSVAVTLLALAASASRAADAGKPEGRGGAADSALALPDAVVTATRTPRAAAGVPRAVNRVGAEDLAARLPRNSAEALREEAGIAVQKTEHGGGNAIVRGLGSNQVLLLVDGIRLNNSTYRFGNHPYLTTVDDRMLDRIEVVRGPGSTLFGSDAMGGTVNLITRDPPIGTAGLEARGRAHARLASADEERILRADGTVAGPGFGLTAGATLRDAGDLRRGGNGPHAWLERSPAVQSHSGYEGRDYDAKLAWRPAPGHDLSFAWQSTARPEVPRYDRYENDGFHRWVYAPQERDLAYATWRGGGATPARAFLSWHRQEEGREIRAEATSPETREWGEVVTYGAGAQVDLPWRDHLLTVGMDAYLDRVDSRREEVDVTTGAVRARIIALYPDGSYYGSYGIFAQDQARLGPDLAATVGARWSLYRLDYGVPYDPALAFDIGRVEQDLAALTAGLGLSWRAGPGVWLHANLAQGFRAPNLSDLARTGESRSGTFEIPNPDLSPERILGMDAGVKLDRERVKGSLFVHHAFISDLMAAAPALHRGDSTHVAGGRTLRLRSKQNIGEAFVSGAEAEARARAWSRLWVRAGLAYVYGRNTTQGEPVGGIPPALGLAGAQWRAARWTLEAFARFAGDQDRLSADDKADARIQPGGTPGWATANLRGDWRALPGLRLSLGLENVLDQNYREHGSGINAPGRNLIGGVDWAF